jgi:hypothetical protein
LITFSSLYKLRQKVLSSFKLRSFVGKGRGDRVTSRSDI